MRAVIMLILAFVAVMIIWGLIKFLIALALGWVFKIAMIMLFCFLVYSVFKALMGKEKQVL